MNLPNLFCQQLGVLLYYAHVHVQKILLFLEQVLHCLVERIYCVVVIFPVDIQGTINLE